MIPPETNPTPNPIFRPEQRSFDVDLTRSNAVRGGVSTGFERLDEYLTIKRGFPLFVAGAPHHGKTQFVKQLLVNLSKLHGFKHAIYLGEEGSIEDIIIELAEIYTGRPVRKLDDWGKEVKDTIDEIEFAETFEWINNHFWIISPDDVEIDSFDVVMFYDWINTYEEEHDVKFDTTVIDPWNDLSFDLESKGGREDLFLADALKKVRDQSRQKERTDIIITHIAAPFAKHRSERGIRFASPAEPYEWAGGQTWHRRAFTMLLIYRPPAPDELRFGKIKIETNIGETWVHIQKSKPRGVGKLGRVTLYYNKKTNTYQEHTLDHEH
jgi:KaiC/GvpD/RAD55 family RecA-like ATPase|tara:strand:+ start:10352 stop:11323 length:972 start_codon:yes stop_codon:yes gene_type:complete